MQEEAAEPGVPTAASKRKTISLGQGRKGKQLDTLFGELQKPIGVQ
jgi:hypothetical protein